MIHVGLSGHTTTFLLDEEGYRSLRSYFERARSRLGGDPDREEVLRDLEQSIGERFAALSPSGGRVIAGNEVDAVLGQVGTVDPGSGNGPDRHESPMRRRPFCRIAQGSWIGGVCTGLAIRSGIRVDWVRTIFILGAVFTGGIVVLVYLALVFALPVVQTRDEYEDLCRLSP
ncbi:phage shock protein PspC [Rhodanobacter thiooxydans LCS2]|nr:phage shock protein PspC [Rhodanobacter thiooxydans LCS2]